MVLLIQQSASALNFIFNHNLLFKKMCSIELQKVFKRAGAIASGKRKKHFSPRPRRAHQDEVPPPASVSASDPQLEVTNNDEQLKDTAVADGDSQLQASKEVLRQEEQSEVLSEGSIIDGDLERPAEECSDVNESPVAEEPSVACQLMSGDAAEGDNLSVEGVVMSVDEREGPCDKTVEQVHIVCDKNKLSTARSIR